MNEQSRLAREQWVRDMHLRPVKFAFGDTNVTYIATGTRRKRTPRLMMYRVSNTIVTESVEVLWQYRKMIVPFTDAALVMEIMLNSDIAKFREKLMCVHGESPE